MRRPLFVASAALAGMALAACAQAALGQSTPGYVCKMLPLTPDQLRDPAALPPVLAAPGGPVIGRAPGIVYARAPEHVVGGYVEIIQYNRHPGWVEASRLVPYASQSNPRATCPPPPWAAAR